MDIYEILDVKHHCIFELDLVLCNCNTAIDVGGVLSKYPKEFYTLIRALEHSGLVSIYVISDMHPKDKIVEMLRSNYLCPILVDPDNVYSADYEKYSEACKAELCKQLDIDILIDDFIGYVGDKDGAKIRLLVMPNSDLPYYAESWKSDDKFDFLRRKNG